MDLRFIIAFIGGCVVLASIRALTRNESAHGHLGREIVFGLALAIGIVTTVAAPLLSGLVRYTTGGTFDYTWWW